MDTWPCPNVGGSETSGPPYRLSRLARFADILLHDIGIDGAVGVLGVSWGDALAQSSSISIPCAAAVWC
jgi:pimeloyl-ACP methyl ester carboxylesterase